MNLVDNVLQDVRFAGRQLRTSPIFTCTAVIVLAFGMAASVAIFAFVDAALIKPLPYQNPLRLVGVFGSIPLFPQSNLSYPDYIDLKKLNTVFSSLEVYQSNGNLLSEKSGTQIVRGARVSDGFFRTLGVTTILGRDFYPGEDSPGVQRTVLLTYSAWQTRYGGQRDVLGKTVTLDNAPNVIIGVQPATFYFPPGEQPVEPATMATVPHYSVLKTEAPIALRTSQFRRSVRRKAGSGDLLFGLL